MERDLLRLDGGRMKGNEASREKGRKRAFGGDIERFMRFWQYGGEGGIFENMGEATGKGILAQ
jgi:hypothetical protein